MEGHPVCPVSRPLSHSTSRGWICPSSGASDQQGLRNRADGIGLLIYTTAPARGSPALRAMGREGGYSGYLGKAAVRSAGDAWAARSRGQPMFLIRPSASNAGSHGRCTPLRLSTVRVEAASPHSPPRGCSGLQYLDSCATSDVVRAGDTVSCN